MSKLTVVKTNQVLTLLSKACKVPSHLDLSRFKTKKTKPKKQRVARIKW